MIDTTANLASNRPKEFMSDKTRQFVEPVRKMLAEGINVQALGETTNQIIEGAFRSLVDHIDELEMDLAALRTAVALASHTPAPQPFDPATSPGMTDMMVDPDTLEAFMEANPLPEEPAPQPGGAVKVKALDRVDEIAAMIDARPFDPDARWHNENDRDRRRNNARVRAKHILSALEPSPSQWNAEAKVREALEWYAEQVAGCRKLSHIGDPSRHALARDGGERAREALGALPLPTPAGEG